jgi:hypothetical protein
MWSLSKHQAKTGWMWGSAWVGLLAVFDMAGETSKYGLNLSLCWVNSLENTHNFCNSSFAQRSKFFMSIGEDAIISELSVPLSRHYTDKHNWIILMVIDWGNENDNGHHRLVWMLGLQWWNCLGRIRCSHVWDVSLRLCFEVPKAQQFPVLLIALMNKDSVPVQCHVYLLAAMFSAVMVMDSNLLDL